MSKIKIIVLILVLAVAGSASAYFLYYQPLHRSPEEVLSRQVAAQTALRSLAIDGKLAITVTPTTGVTVEPSTVILNYQSFTDVSVIDAPRGSFVLELTASDLPAASAAFIPERQVALALEGLFAEQNLYLKFKQLPIIPFFFDTASFQNRWIKIATKELKDKFGAQETSSLSSEEQTAIKGLLEKRRLLTVTEDLPAEMIDGVDAYHYRFQINRDELVLLLTDLAALLGEPDQLAPLLPLLNSFALPTGEIWIGKKDFLPRQVIFAGEVTLADAGFKVNYKWEQKQSRFNEPVTVTPPADAINLEDLLAPLLGNFLIGTTTTEEF